MVRPIDIEDLVRTILADYGLTAFCRPLPESYSLPNILISAVGGYQDKDWHGIDQFDRFIVNLNCRAEDEASALETIRSAIGILQNEQGNKLCSVTVNSAYSWGRDSVRPDLAMCGSTLIIAARPENFTIGGTI